MADQKGGSAAGCVLVLAVLALMFWPLVLTAAAVLLACGLVGWVAASHRFGELRMIVEAASRRFAGDVCVVEGRYGVVRSIELQGEMAQPRIALVLDLIHDGAHGPVLNTSSRRLTPPAMLNGLRSNAGVARFLKAHGVGMVGDLAVEAKATRAALACLQDVAWARDALDQLEVLHGSARTTLAKAEGNELLEPSIPQLQEAISAFEVEARKLQAALEDSSTMLRKLHDFLEVPEGIRPILSFDIDTLFDPQRLKDLEQSFDEVVLLNDAFRDLSRQKLA